MIKRTGDPSPDESGLSQSEKEIIDMDFAAYPIGEDIGNSLSSILMRNLLGGLESIKPIQIYEEYMREMASKSQNPVTYYDYVMSKSDQVVVKKWNDKVLAFNEDLENIKQNKDDAKVQAFYDGMIDFLREKGS